MGGLLLVAQPFVVTLALALWVGHNGISVLNADGIVQAAHSSGAAPEIPKFALLIQSGGVPNDVIMDVGLVDVRTDDVSMIAFCEALRQLAAQAIGFLRCDLAGTERLAQMIGNHIIRASHPTSVSDVLLLGKEKFAVGNPAVTLPAGNQPSIVGFSRIFYIVDNCSDSGSGSSPFANVQRHEPCGCHEISSLQEKPRCRNDTGAGIRWI